MMDARTLTASLGGRWYGHYGLAFCPAHRNVRTPALSLADGRNGALLAHCFSGCTFPEIIAALRNRNLMTDVWHQTTDPAELAMRHRAEKAVQEKRVAQARSVWETSQPIASTLAEHYLRNRGITCELPANLRYQPECWHGPTARRYPAMVAKVERRGELVGVHRTYLAEGGVKANLTDPKLALGVCAGAAVRLSDRAGPLVLCEGVETGLSLMGGLDGRCGGVWACLGTSGLAGIHLPAGVREIVVASDGDEPGRNAANALAARAMASGIKARIMYAPVGLDWNDVACGKTPEVVA